MRGRRRKAYVTDMPDELSRVEWYKRASANLRSYLAELEAALASDSFDNKKPIEHLITELKRRLADLDRAIDEAEKSPPILFR